MRESEQTQRMKSQGDLVPERRLAAPSTTSSTTHSNIPLMAMTPMSASTSTASSSNTSAMFLKDLTSSLFDQSAPTPAQSMYGMSTSQTMPSLLRPTAPMIPQQPIRPAMNFSSSSNTTDLTSSLMNNLNILGSRSQTSSTAVPMNALANASPYFNSGPTNNGGLFQPPPPPGSTVVKGTTGPTNMTRSKTAASELDDLFN